MRNINANLLGRLTGVETQLTECMLITTRDGRQLGFTKLNANLTVDGVLYRAAPALEITNVGAEAGLSVDEAQVKAVFVEGYVTRQDLRSRRFEDARYERFIVNWQHPADGKLTLQKGRLGRITIVDDGFSVELHSLTTLAQRPVGDLCAATCRHKRLGDSGCRLELNGSHPTLNVPLRVRELIVTAVQDEQTFRFAVGTAPDGYFTDGLVYFTSGENNGLEQDVLSHTRLGDVAEIVLQEPMPVPVRVGDVFAAEWGCDRTLKACESVANVVNRDAEDYLPGRSKLLEAGI